MTYDVIASGSSGNAVVINGEILIDCGVPYKTLEQSGYIKRLKLVLLTHQHSDHFCQSTVRALHKERPSLRFGCCDWMLKSEKNGKEEPGPIIKAGVDKRLIDVFEPGIHKIYDGGRLFIKAETLVHDVPNCGWKILIYEQVLSNDGMFHCGNGDKLFYATDTATLDHVSARCYNTYLIEGNHTRDEIEARIADKQARGEFSYEVRAARNHLSQEQAMDWLARNVGPQSRYVFLHQHRNRGDKDG